MCKPMAGTPGFAVRTGGSAMAFPERDVSAVASQDGDSADRIARRSGRSVLNTPERQRPVLRCPMGIA